MSLMGIDVGTTGCKASVFAPDGALLGAAYREYDVTSRQPGWAELDVARVWDAVQSVIGEAARQASGSPVTALCASSMGEAVVPVTADRRWLADSPLNFDERGAEFVSALAPLLPDDLLYPINGNTLGNHYSLTKMLWWKKHQPEVYEKTAYFLHWGAFVSFMLGAEPAVDYALANRSLLFDIDKGDWSDHLLRLTGIAREKLPRAVPCGTAIGTIPDSMATRLGLPKGVAIVSGAHDQCANSVGAGVLSEGMAMLGMGTYICITPVFAHRQDPAVMARNGLCTEHHAAPGRFVSFLYNHGGSLVKWHRDTFAALDKERAATDGSSIYALLGAEMPDEPSEVMVLPNFAPTGPPEFIADSSGVMTGLKLGTTRGAILKGIMEGVLYYMRECVDLLPAGGTPIKEFRAGGGGSQSDAWLQIAADILGAEIVRPRVLEAGALGSAIIAGSATGVFSSIEDGVKAMVHVERGFSPEPGRSLLYNARYAKYKQLWPLLREFLTSQ